MIEKKLTTLIFGNVVLESSMTGCDIRVYSDDYRSYYMHTKRQVVLKAPLDELKSTATPSQKKAVAKHVFDEVEAELEETYPGGVDAASEAFNTWLNQD